MILILTDDQGYADVGAHGNRVIRAPQLDRLAGESVRFTDFHVDPTCSPTRAALLTGRYSTRTGVWHTIMGRSLMAPRERTVAELFSASGYRTGMFGKWHLGDNYPLRPHDQGFEEALYHGGGVVGQVGDDLDNDLYDDSYDLLVEALAGRCDRCVQGAAVDILGDRLEASVGGNLGDSSPHDAGPHDGDLLHAHCRASSAMNGRPGYTERLRHRTRPSRGWEARGRTAETVRPRPASPATPGEARPELGWVALPRPCPLGSRPLGSPARPLGLARVRRGSPAPALARLRPPWILRYPQGLTPPCSRIRPHPSSPVHAKARAPKPAVVPCTAPKGWDPPGCGLGATARSPDPRVDHVASGGRTGTHAGGSARRSGPRGSTCPGPRGPHFHFRSAPLPRRRSEAGGDAFRPREGYLRLLDPLIALLKPDIERSELAKEPLGELIKALSRDHDPIEVTRRILDRYALAGNDDYQGHYFAAFSARIPADGEYWLAIGSSLARPSEGSYRLAVGVDAPDVLSDGTKGSGRAFVFAERTAETPERVVALAAGELTSGQPVRFYNLADLAAGQTFYAYAENAGCFPPELELRNEVVNMSALINTIDDDKERLKKIREFNFKLLRLNIMRKRPFNLDELPDYEFKVADKLTGGL